jgi:hypothetical protein
MTNRMKPVSWFERPRSNRLASILWPNLADQQAQREMAEITAAEGKKSPMQGVADARQADKKREWASTRKR